ncbi:MAG: mechanosensitive ion channel, partial [Alphaproteobacteria bacterium]|nr:mechanosensitive ion channel [Alphaproteobacteria bacterium]
VTYNSKPRRVREILLECAKEHPSVLSHPAPSVFFKDFGDSALIFELRVFIRNIRDIYDVSTDLRLMIWDKLHEENIEIPFPQRDLHIKSSDLEKVIEKISPKLAGGPDHG